MSNHPQSSFGSADPGPDINVFPPVGGRWTKQKKNKQVRVGRFLLVRAVFLLGYASVFFTSQIKVTILMIQNA